MALKAKQPEAVVPNKPKFMVSGESGVGKTFFALDFPKPYLIDTESGATRSQYQEKLKKAGGAYFGKEEGSQDFPTVLAEIKQLATEKHEFKTLIIDSFSYLYLMEAARAEEEGGSEYGRDKKEANKPTRQLIRWLEKLDMNVILICHSKAKWKSVGKERIQDGTTFDGYDKMEFILDLWIEIPRGGKNFTVKKSRIQSLPQDSSFPLSYEKFAEIYGKTIVEGAAKPAEMANHAQIVQMESLIETLNVQPEQIEKWFKKVDVDDWSEMTAGQIQSLIENLQEKARAASGQNTKSEPATVPQKVKAEKVKK